MRVAIPATLLAAAILLLLGLMRVLPALGAPPPGTHDPATERYFQGLRWRDNEGGFHDCCGLADCRVTQARQKGDGWDVLIDSRFPSFPDGEAPRWEHITANSEHLSRQPNQIGEPVACWQVYRGLECFNPLPET